ncbi:hypothetical protein ACH3XW_46040 [Acanthocheilonema viteae]
MLHCAPLKLKNIILAFFPQSYPGDKVEEGSEDERENSRMAQCEETLIWVDLRGLLFAKYLGVFYNLMSV